MGANWRWRRRGRRWGERGLPLPPLVFLSSLPPPFLRGSDDENVVRYK